MEDLNWLQLQLLQVLTLWFVVMQLTVHIAKDEKPHCRLYTYHTCSDKTVPLCLTAIFCSNIDEKFYFNP